eukprot:TRINITY_DN2485_c0_g4_i3.p1 TRINITY_DN2485_c0_g4~~TRINITY_DN2485_c0_g4_i3.p1  ORF type:complete len:590 (+),score=68.76 TRINITY_DN2485_c0_g4_i3:51-1820(+)
MKPTSLNRNDNTEKNLAIDTPENSSLPSHGPPYLPIATPSHPPHTPAPPGGFPSGFPNMPGFVPSPMMYPVNYGFGHYPYPVPYPPYNQFPYMPPHMMMMQHGEGANSHPPVTPSQPLTPPTVTTAHVLPALGPPRFPPPTSSTDEDNSDGPDDDSEDERHGKRLRAPSSLSVALATKSEEFYSCHHCKTRKPAVDVFFCSNITHKQYKNSLLPKQCRKKYCRNCITKIYRDFEYNFDSKSWVCPACRDQCGCACCRRERILRVNKADHESSHTQSTPSANTPNFLTPIFPASKADSMSPLPSSPSSTSSSSSPSPALSPTPTSPSTPSSPSVRSTSSTTPSSPDITPSPLPSAASSSSPTLSSSLPQSPSLSSTPTPSSSVSPPSSPAASSPPSSPDSPSSRPAAKNPTTTTSSTTLPSSVNILPSDVAAARKRKRGRPPKSDVSLFSSISSLCQAASSASLASSSTISSAPSVPAFEPHHERAPAPELPPSYPFPHSMYPPMPTNPMAMPTNPMVMPTNSMAMPTNPMSMSMAMGIPMSMTMGGMYSNGLAGSSAVHHPPYPFVPSYPTGHVPFSEMREQGVHSPDS